MSWKCYVDDQLMSTNMVKHAVICGYNGQIWAQSEGFTVQACELKDLIAKFSDTDMLAKTGVTIAGVRYMYLSSGDRVIRAKKGTSGIHVMKTIQTFIVCVYEDPVVPEQVATVTEKLGDYLIQMGF